MLLGNTQLLPVTASLWSKIGRSTLLLLSAGPHRFHCSHFINTACSHAAVLKPYYEQIPEHGCLSGSEKTHPNGLCGVSQCLQGVSLLIHLLVYLGNTSLFSEEDFPLCCQAFSKVLIVPIFKFLYLQGV